MTICVLPTHAHNRVEGFELTLVRARSSSLVTSVKPRRFVSPEDFTGDVGKVGKASSVKANLLALQPRRFVSPASVSSCLGSSTAVGAKLGSNEESS